MDKLFVSRGGVKLQAAIEKFKLEIKNDIVLDVGSSTGGFVDCLLQNGAAKIYSVDTAYGELAWKLRNDQRMIVLERTNILHLQSLPSPVISSPSTLVQGERSQQRDFSSSIRNDNVKVDLVTIDAGWTKLELILPVIKQFLKENGTIVALLKPHYELDNKKLLVKGVVPLELVEKVKDEVLEKIQSLGFVVVEVIESPILGGGGNKEFLVHLIPEGRPKVSGKRSRKAA